MEPSKEAIAVRVARLNRMILGKQTGVSCSFNKKTINREALFDALSVLYDECNDDPIKKADDLVRVFVDKYRSTLAELRRARVCLSDFNIIQNIGKGQFGDVHMVREKETSDVYALKTLRKELMLKRGTSSIDEERDILASGNTPWIPKLQYAFQDNSNLYLVMELCLGGDLSGVLSRSTHPMSECDAAFYVAEVAHALKALHNLGYVHRDVKPSNILVDRCGHIKLGDFGSCARLSDGGSGSLPVATADYVAPELLAAVDCAARHKTCADCCKGFLSTSASACDYWSLGVIAFELVTLRRPFSNRDEDSVAQILSNIQRYERDPNPSPPFDAPPAGPSTQWRSLVAGLLRTKPTKRFHYLDTLQHAALRHLSTKNIRDQVPPWVPCVRGSEDAVWFSPSPRRPPPPSAAAFRTRDTFDGQLPFVGFSYVAPDEGEDSITGGFNASSLDCTAIDLASFKSAEKIAAMRAKEISNLQNKLAEAEACISAEVEKARRAADDEAEVTRARLQGEITALTLQNKRLERQIEIEKEERLSLERNTQEISCSKERSSAELRRAQCQAAELECERGVLREEARKLEARVRELEADCDRALAAADSARAQQRHYKESVAKERALRRQTLSGVESEHRESAARIAAAEANVSSEMRARQAAEDRLAAAEAEIDRLKADLAKAASERTRLEEAKSEKHRVATASTEELKQVQSQLTQERVRSSTLVAQIQELQRSLEEAAQRESALEEQGARTEARLKEQLEAAELRATEAHKDDTRHRDKVTGLEKLVRQLEREVNALEVRNSMYKKEAASDTESVGERETDAAAQAQIALLKQQLEDAHAQLQGRADEIATLKQETRAANLARWRKEREYNDLSVEAKTATRDLKRLEERVTMATEARKTAEQKLASLQTEVTELRPKYEAAAKELQQTKVVLEKLQKEHNVMENEIDRSRNDIMKLKCELKYSEQRRVRAETQESLASAERAQLRDQLTLASDTLRVKEQDTKALQEACSLLEDQLTDLEKLADLNELKNQDLEKENTRLRDELNTVRSKLSESEKLAAERAAAATLAAQSCGDVTDQLQRAQLQNTLLTERLEHAEARIAELETLTTELESAKSSLESSINSAGRRMRDLQEECAGLRTRAHQHHAQAMQLQAELTDAQEELVAAREASAAAAAWWRTRETKADSTLRQQAKLIDFLQAKVEEARRKKSCSLSNKLFGRSARRTPNTVSPPLRRANRELREEVERLRAKLAVQNGGGDISSCPSTPMRPKKSNGVKPVMPVLNIDTVDYATKESSMQVIWSDGTRETASCHASNGCLELWAGGRQYRARPRDVMPAEGSLSAAQRDRAVALSIESPSEDNRRTCTLVCTTSSERDSLTGCLSVGSRSYRPTTVVTLRSAPHTAVLVDELMAIGCADGLHSVLGPLLLETSPPPAGGELAVSQLAVCGGRLLAVVGGRLLTCSLSIVRSVLKRANSLQPSLAMEEVELPDNTQPIMLRSSTSDKSELIAVVSCGRRVFVLRGDPSGGGPLRVARSLTVCGAPRGLLLAPAALYLCGDKPLRLPLPAAALDSFAATDLVVAAAARARTPPRALLLLRDSPLELLLCYDHCGVFLDERGDRTRPDEIKWRTKVDQWAFVRPFLYTIHESSVAIAHLCEDSYRAPPCTCDSHSLASTTTSEGAPETFTLELREPALLGVAAAGVVVRYRSDDQYAVCVVEGAAAFRSVGASIESLTTAASDGRGSSSDLTRSPSDASSQGPENVYRENGYHDSSHESVEPNTGFLADIKKRAQQLRKKNRQTEQTPDDVIKEILTTEVGMKRSSNGRMSPATTSEFSSDSESETLEKNVNDLCAEMFTRQVRFKQ